MEIIRTEKVIHAEKPDGTRISYYLFPEYEIHYNEIPPGTTQVWHHHEQVAETILILDGQLEALWKEDGSEKRAATLKKGDLAKTGKTPHTFVNSSRDLVRFVVFKLVLNGTNYQELFKKDKVIDE